ncbi:LOW QUALITY PROTEIN: adrenodoxin-like protein 2, mitochondrial [Dioscorea cayenensis subsp. rotundata]|uniref:LOW QUALITY PROTEIN: adrenodoxin-like protein 2, mitochondrial n=1 Tax=Dioscorea cayennensis subsp. rotundata TaxID=55577 RepID=A0AB40AUI5_DIOCR|nr:LOW QUALITY PROTEIN: adrenodoxin-like protein 2, mitochondrial [Dioscorea cayenensis subsp. rotundata]
MPLGYPVVLTLGHLVRLLLGYLVRMPLGHPFGLLLGYPIRLPLGYLVRPPLRHPSVAIDNMLGLDVPIDDKQLLNFEKFSNTQRGYYEGTLNNYLYYLRNRTLSTTSSDNAQEGSEQQTEKISVTFVDKDGEEKLIKVPVGMSMLEAAHENDIELEGACEGSIACSTCHVIVMDVNYYNKLEDPTDEENDMLDLAFGLTQTSRLGCQVIAKPELDGMRLALPAATRNFAVDGYIPKPH